MIAEFKSYTGVAPQGWDDIVRRLGGTVFHNTLWAEYRRRAANVQPVFLLARDRDGNPCAGAVALFRKSRRPLVSWIFREIQLTAHPFVTGEDPTMTISFFRHCEDLSRKFRCARIGIDSFMSGRSAFIPSEHGYMETRRLEFILDLTRDLDSLWKGMQKDQRERVRSLKRKGLTVEVGVTFEDLDGLRNAREATQAKRSHLGQGYQLTSGDDFYRGIHEYLIKTNAGRLLVARHEGQVVAAIFFATFNGKACSVFSGSTESGYKLGAQSSLFWTAVELFKAEGFVELNRGGVLACCANQSDPLHGIYLFKLRLGTTPVLCRSGVKVVDPMRDWMTRMRDGLRGSQ